MITEHISPTFLQHLSSISPTFTNSWFLSYMSYFPTFRIPYQASWVFSPTENNLKCQMMDSWKMSGKCLENIWIIQTFSRHFPDIFQLSDLLTTHHGVWFSRHFPDIFQQPGICISNSKLFRSKYDFYNNTRSILRIMVWAVVEKWWKKHEKIMGFPWFSMIFPSFFHHPDFVTCVHGMYFSMIFPWFFHHFSIC